MKNNKLILSKEELYKEMGSDYKDLLYLFDDKFGIISAVLKRKELKKYNLYMYQCLSANVKDLFCLSREVSSGGLGVSNSKKRAIISCVAEAIERYCMSYISLDEVYLSKLQNISDAHKLDDFYTYNSLQYSEQKQFLNPYKDEIYWTKIYSVTSKKKWKYWPASLIYLPFELSNSVAENTSTGMAAGSSLHECILSGLLELIERDALMINFLQRLNPLEIDINSITHVTLIEKIKKDYKLKIYKLYSDIDVPIYLSFIWKEKFGNLHYGIGASAHLDSDEAINKALKESLFTYFYSKNIMDMKKNNAQDITALYEHFLYYQDEKFYKLLFSSKIEKYEYKKIDEKHLMQQLSKNGIEVYYKDLTTDDIKASGIKVVKVIAPSLIDLNKSHQLPRLGAKRFWSVPKKLGLLVHDTLSDLPHPFP